MWKKRHYKRVCTSTAVDEITEDNSRFFLGVILPVGDPEMFNLKEDGRRAKFKIDSGADVTVISNKIFNQIHGNNVPKLPKATRMCSTGCSKGFENRKRKKMKQEQACVIKNLYTALLGRRSITKLELVSRVHSLNLDILKK